MDIFELIQKDHREVENLFAELEGTRDSKKLQKLFNQLYRELSVHAESEELTFYPAMREYEETEKFLDEAEEEHVDVKVMIEEMKSVSLSSPEFRERLTDLKEAVQHHVEEEENEVFPKVRQCMSAEELDQLAEEFQNMRNQLEDEMIAVT